MNNKSAGLCLLLILFFIPFSFSYSEVLEDNANFDNLLFFEDSGFTPFQYVNSMTSGKFAPLVYDWDDDGDVEIIAFDTSGILVYDNQMNGIAGYTTNTANISYPYMYDLNEDGIKELLLYHPRLKNVQSYTFNGTVISNTTIFKDSSIDGNPNTQSVLTCTSDKKCLILEMYGTAAPGAAHQYIYSWIFNTTGIIRGKTTLIGVLAADKICLPSINKIAVADIDSNGYEDFIFNMYEMGDQGRDETLWTYILYMDNGGYMGNYSVETGLGEVIALISDQQNCFSPAVGHRFTAPLVAETKTTNTGLEIYSAYQTSNGWTMSIKNKDLVTLENYPESLLGLTAYHDGDYASNLALCDIHPETGLRDVCVYFVDETNDELTLMCSYENKGTHESFIFENFLGEYDISPFNQPNIMHCVNAQIKVQDGNDADEILSSFGVISTEDGFIWGNTLTNGMMIPAHLNGDTRGEIVGLQPNNIYAIYDGYVNTDCGDYECIKTITTNPATNAGAVQVNTTFHVQARLTEPDGDTLSAKFYLYYGTPNQQNTSWSAFASNSTIFTSTTLKLNQTTDACILRVEARESNNPSEIDYEEITFSVALQGVEFGDGTSDYDTGEPPADEYTEGDGNAVDEMSDILEETTGLSKGIIWLILMCLIPLVGLYVMSKSSLGPGDFKLGMIFISLFLVVWFVMGAVFGFISFGIIITVVVIALAILALVIARALGGGNSL